FGCGRETSGRGLARGGNTLGRSSGRLLRRRGRLLRGGGLLDRGRGHRRAGSTSRLAETEQCSEPASRLQRSGLGVVLPRRFAVPTPLRVREGDEPRAFGELAGPPSPVESVARVGDPA